MYEMTVWCDATFCIRSLPGCWTTELNETLSKTIHYFYNLNEFMFSDTLFSTLRFALWFVNILKLYNNNLGRYDNGDWDWIRRTFCCGVGNLYVNGANLSSRIYYFFLCFCCSSSYFVVLCRISLAPKSKVTILNFTFHAWEGLSGSWG